MSYIINYMHNIITQFHIIKCNVTKGKLYGSRDSDHAIVHLGLNVSSSTHNCGCVVDGGNAMAAI